MLREVALYAGMAWGLKKLLRAPERDYASEFRRQLENRAEIFLENVRSTVFARPDHPYSRMFQLARCDYADPAAAVRRQGLEAPLEAIRRLPKNDFSPVSEWIAARRAQGVFTSLTSYVSPAVRVAAAMKERLNVTGATLTDSKRAVIERAGAEIRINYATTEIGAIGASCRQMKTGNCVHLYRDALAVISHRRPAPLSDVQVNSLLFTTLLPFAPHLFINVEMDDSGTIAPAACDCALSRAGLTTCIQDIGSSGKLTGQGITLVGSDIVRILEVDLPAQFGGHPGDYQLVEHEGSSQTQITLRISPRTGVASTTVGSGARKAAHVS